MKIAIVGCGAVGSYYGAMLARAGEDVHFLLRTDYEAVSRHGVSIRSPAGDFNVRPRSARGPQEIGVSDVVLIALKTTANDQFPRLLPPLVGPDTAVVTLQNGLGNEEALQRLFPVGQVLGGLCFVCLNRLEPGLIQHTDHGLVVLGEFQRAPEPRTHALAAMFRRAGVACKVTDNLARAHWEKLVWNIPFNGLGVAGVAGREALINPMSAIHHQLHPHPCLTTERLLADPGWETLVRELMGEIILAANALGHGLDRTLAEQMIQRTRTMGAYKASTLLDFEKGRPLELESLFLEPLRQAHLAGVANPRLAALCGVLQQLDLSWAN
jgi:2-dehydropantoate 2-reductase